MNDLKKLKELIPSFGKLDKKDQEYVKQIHLELLSKNWKLEYLEEEHERLRRCLGMNYCEGTGGMFRCDNCQKTKGEYCFRCGRNHGKDCSLCFGDFVTEKNDSEKEALNCLERGLQKLCNGCENGDFCVLADFQ